MSLFSKVCKFIEKERLFTIQDKLLLAVSGGRDSMTMLDLLFKGAFDIEVAHVNYMLRGEDSNLDAALVEQTCSRHGVTFHMYQVDLVDQELLQKGNLQSVARTIRYRFFKKTCEERDIKFVCTAHHREDRIETFFLNLNRASGLKGLTSLPAQNQIIRRPMLGVSGADIDTYVKSYDINFRDDATNASDTYDRNFLRHHVLNRLEERWPEIFTSISTSLDHLTDSDRLLQQYIKSDYDHWVTNNDEYIEIGPLSELRRIHGAKTLLYYLTKKYDLKSDALHLLLNEKPLTGSDYSNTSYRIVYNRDYLIINPLNTNQTLYKTLDALGKLPIDEYYNFQIQEVRKFHPSPDSGIEFVDLDKVRFPLIIRTWRQADRIKPLGMSGKSKLVSDLLIDKKVDLISKDKVMVVVCNDEIIWVINYCLNDTYRISAQTTRIGQLSYRSDLKTLHRNALI